MATAPKQLSDPQAEKLRQIHTIPSLVKYLDEELGWPIHVDDWEDAVFDWQPEELNLKAEHQIAIHSIKQLRPLVTGQPWGIFFVDFDKGRLPIVVLRRMLNGLVIKSRGKGGGHQTWLARDLLFISSFGEANSREIALAHFTDESETGDLPTLRVLGWDEADTALEIGYVAKTLREKLRWPFRTATKIDQDDWRTQWASAFSLKYRQVINDSKSLALALAVLAKRIRSRVNDVLELESDKGHLSQLHKAFKENLIADLTADGFADMFAQTITYGLFTARASRSSGALVADDISQMVPSTNPFLKELLADFLNAAGRDRKKSKRVDFDELGINEVVTTLRDVPMDAVLRAFNKDKPGDDPVIHFYEDFLKAYDKKMRAKRGVFYTPGPVVHFIVRSVDEILKTEFGIKDGLASTITWGEMIHRKPELKLPKFCTLDTPFVQVLDPATGTGTFIVEVITQVHAHMLAKWAKQGKVTKPQWQPLWVDYVKQHLLPRLYAFELMMAPYAIAHMKIGLKLFETGYTFPEGGPRVNVFLTNALEPAHVVNPGLEFEAPMLAHEAAAANRVKEQLIPTVLIGNPPYSVISGNMFEEAKALVDRYRAVDGKPIVERSMLRLEMHLQDDYVKFVSYVQGLCERSTGSIFGLITNRGYLVNRSLRGVRDSLLRGFSRLLIVDLHGDGELDELVDRDADENVFDIEQGVAISVGVIAPPSQSTAIVQHVSIIGSRASKYELLSTQHAAELRLVRITPQPDSYYFRDDGDKTEWTKLWALESVMSQNLSGIVTAHDSLVVAFEDQPLRQLAVELKDDGISDSALRNKYEIKDNAGWKFSKARKSFAADAQSDRCITDYDYRLFDRRRLIYHTELVWSDRKRLVAHILRGNNKALAVCGQLAHLPWEHVFVSTAPQDDCYLSNRTKERSYFFPQWIYTSSGREANIAFTFVKALASALDLSDGDWCQEAVASPLNAENIFHYLYAILHSPAYRQRYAAFLRTDFPRIPIPGSRALFEALAALGAQLVAWHLLEHPDAARIFASSARPAKAVAWFGNDFSLQRVGEKGKSLADISGDVGNVLINASSGFANVNSAVWQHTIGGYQVLHKWLDDRRKAGRSLSQDDITHWLRVYAALEVTQGLMSQVDAAIETHGGWPSAFSHNHPPPDAATLAAEQMVQKEQLKAQKKAVTATKKRASYASPTGASSLFDDLEDMAGAAGGPDRPKSRATPAKAAGGSSNSADWAALCAIRAVLAHAGAGGILRKDLIRQTARALGHARISPRIAEALDRTVRLAVRRGIAINDSGNLCLVARRIDDYDREFLKQHLSSCLTKVWRGKTEVPLRFARSLGFSRTGPKLEELVWTLMASLRRGGSVEMQGRGVNAQYRKSQNLKGSGV